MPMPSIHLDKMVPMKSSWQAATACQGRSVDRIYVTVDVLKVTCRRCQKLAAAQLKARVQELTTLHSQGFVQHHGAIISKTLWDLGEELTKRVAGTFTGFEDLLGAWTKHGYRPTLRSDSDPMAEVLADLYDYAQTRRGNDVKAYRGG